MTMTNTNKAPIAPSLSDLATRIENDNSLMDALGAQAGPHGPALFEPERENKQEQIFLDAGSYIQLAIEMLATCAQDLIAADRVLNAEPGTVATRTFNRAAELRRNTVAWLEGYVEEPPFFSFADCALLIEHELRLLSLDRHSLPDIFERRQELAAWIIEDPKQANTLFTRYRTIFGDASNSADEIDGFDLDGSMTEPETYVQAYRPRG